MTKIRSTGLLLLLAFLALAALSACAPKIAEASASEIPTFTLVSTTNGELEPPTAGRQQSASQVFDVDNDGVNDIVIGSRVGDGPYVVWYRRTADGWQRYVIEDEEVTMSPSGTYVDIDQDGDTDIIMGGGSDSPVVWWWENPYPDYDPAKPWQRYTLKTGGETKHHDWITGDFDNDGTPEVVFWNQYDFALNLAELPDDPQSLTEWPYTAIFTWEGDDYKLEGLETYDFDGDGLLDLAGAGRWFQNNGDLTFTPHEIDLDYEYGRVAVGQLVPGGYPEVVYDIGDGEGKLEWFQWDGEAWKGTVLGDLDHGHSLQIVDINRDGYLDIFAAEMRLDSENEDSGMWFYLGDGEGNFRRALVAQGFDNHENRVADLDGDGDLDILGKPFNHEVPALHIWINEGMPASLDRWKRHVIDEERPGRALFITGADLNGDGLNDVLSGGWWYKNPGEPMGSWERAAIGEGLNNLAAAHDFDGDGAVDVLGTQGEGADPNPNFVWARNDGQGGFTIHDNIQPGAGTFLQGVAVDSFSADALGVALSWHNDEAPVQMIEVPADPVNEDWTMRDLSDQSQAEGIDSGDIDGDGQPDLLLGKIWLKNGNWSASPVVETEGEPDRNLLADMNGDGRLDAVLGYEAKNEPGPLAWYEQPASAGEAWVEHLIADPPIVAPMSVDVVDLDGDGDLDVVAGEHNRDDPDKAGLYVFENVDGKGTEWARYTVYVGDEHHVGAQTVDLDNDGDLDILSIGWDHGKVVVYENLSPRKVKQ